MREIDAFFDELNPDIKVIWGLSDDDSLDEDAKVTILATGLNNELADEIQDNPVTTTKDEDDYQRIIDKLYHPIRDDFQSPKKADPPEEDIPAEPSNTESTDIPDEDPAPLTPDAPTEESPVKEEKVISIIGTAKTINAVTLAIIAVAMTPPNPISALIGFILAGSMLAFRSEERR